jgi:hypothetical protein
VADVERERGADRRRRVQPGGHEAETAQVREQGGDAHGRGSGFILKRLYEFGEATLARLAEELLSNPTVAAAFSQALGKAFEAKGRMDRNMQTLLALLNLPSRADVHRLVTKLEAVQGSLVNLNLKVDRLLAEGARRRDGARRRRPTPRPDDEDE